MTEEERRRRIVSAIGDFSTRARKKGLLDDEPLRGPLVSNPPPPKKRAKKKTTPHNELVKAILLWLRETYGFKWCGWDNQVTHRIIDPRTKRSFWVPAGKTGAPDILGCLFGSFVGIEVKTGRGELTDKQRRFADRLIAADGLFVEARTLTQARQEVREWLISKAMELTR